jgi:uncharacterized MAPEG superfamily protein
VKDMLVALGSGFWIVAVVFVVVFLGVAAAVYSRSGSDVSEHPLGRDHAGGAPGAAGRGETAGRDAGESTPLDQHGTR